MSGDVPQGLAIGNPLVLVRWAVVSDGANPVRVLQKLVAVGLDGAPEVGDGFLVHDKFVGGLAFFGGVWDDTDDSVGDGNGVGDVDEGLAVVWGGF